MVKDRRAAKTFLIADDEPSIRELLRRYFSARGVQVILAADGIETLKQVREQKPDVVFLDISMPGMDGLEVLKKLKESDPKLPVIVISGLLDLDTAKQAMLLGARDFLKKPIDLDYLVMSSTLLSMDYD